MNVEQLRKQAKELVRAAREGDPSALARLGDLPVQLASAQLVLAREHGFASWPKLKAYVSGRGRAAVPRRHRVLRGPGGRDRDDVSGVSVDEARRELPRRHGFSELGRARAARRGARERGGAADAVRARLPRGRGGDRRRLDDAARRASRARRAARHERQRPARDGRRPRASCGCCSSAAPTRIAATTTAGRSCTRPATRTTPALARLMLDAGARTDLSARGDGGTPLIAALFWGHREVAELLGLEPGNLRVAAGLGDSTDPRARRARRRPARTAASTGRTAASRRGSPRTTRRRCSTRRSSGRRRPTGSRRSGCWSISARAWRPIRTAARRSPGRRRTAASLRSGGWSSSAPT